MFSDCLKVLSSLEKVMPNEAPAAEELKELSVLSNERFSFQISYTRPGAAAFWRSGKITFRVISPLEKYITVRRVGFVPSELAFIEAEDSDFGRKDVINEGRPGLYPDPLFPMEAYEISTIPEAYDALWFTVDTNGEAAPGKYNIDVEFTYSDGETERGCVKSLLVEIVGASLPEQKLIFTQWFHTDCISDYYKLEVFSEEHWHYIELFARTAAKNGINMLLTPILTPPLDTQVGGERTTVQLVDIAFDGKDYTFDFSKLGRWFDLCLSCGIKYFEMAHLFSQWGARYCPKIMATVNGEYKKIFGWDNSATGDEYRFFLSRFLPALTSYIESRGLKDVTFFHISDEPHGDQITDYKAAKAGVTEYLKGYRIIDAMSDIEYYKSGVIEMPVPSIRVTDAFKEVNVKPLWTYYCITAGSHFSNRFFCYHSYQNRILGTQLYKYDVDGFLHWGYNFYNTQYSKKRINPYIVTDAGRAFSSGDAFSVYPGDDCCVESLRLVVFHECLQDMRALELLSSLIGREETENLIDEVAGMKVDLANYPKNAAFILALRKRVNETIKSKI